MKHLLEQELEQRQQNKKNFEGERSFPKPSQDRKRKNYEYAEEDGRKQHKKAKWKREEQRHIGKEESDEEIQ